MIGDIWHITNDAEWHERRRPNVNGSESAAVLHVDPHKTAARVAAEKLGLISPQPSNAFLQFRLALEAAAIDMLKFHRPTWDIRRPRVYVCDHATRRGATMDAVATDPEREGFGVIECKTVLQSVYEREWRDLDGDLAEAPLHYQIQTLHNSMVCGASWAAVAALVLESAGTGFFKLAPVDVDNSEAKARILDGIARFWAIVDTGRIPLPLNYELDADVIAALYPEARIKEPPLDLTGDNRLPDLLRKRAENKKQIKQFESECEAIDNEIKEKLGHHEQARLPGWRLSWKMQTRPERIMAEWKGRVLRITESKTGASS